MTVSKEQFVDYINFIKEKSQQQESLCEVLDLLDKDNYHMCFIYSDYECKLLSLLAIALNDTEDLITYKLYEFDSFFDEDARKEQLKETPYLESWETLYDYLMKAGDNKDASN